MNVADPADPSECSSNSSGPEESPEEIRARQRKENHEIMKTTGLPINDITEFREIFELVDEDKGGSIDQEELRKLTDIMNIEISTDELEKMVSEIDSTKTGEIYFDDFVKSMSQKPDVDYTEDDVIEAFEVLSRKDHKNKEDLISFNIDQPGKISQTRLEYALMNYKGENLSKKETEKLLGMSEFSVTGYLDYVDLVKTMMSSVKDS